jgi:hypothetical protein
MDRDAMAWVVFIGGITLELVLALMDFPKVVIHIPIEPVKDLLKDMDLDL